ncbi:MAG: hypothetical protein H6585_08220 [Flavobacteriales bacterium]|nr:hypothetical protein [Flavobacteriales bacterium]MCB9448314.1 hypothetical protein [Flavobacteriales bacterium]
MCRTRIYLSVCLSMLLIGLVSSASAQAAQGTKSKKDSTAVNGYTGVDSSFYYAGDVWSVAHYEKGHMHGSYQLWYENGEKWFEGVFKEGKPYHVLMEYYQDGGRKMEIMRNGDVEKTVAWYENGNTSYEMEFKSGLPQNKHVYWYANGNVKLESNFAEGLRDGIWSYYTSDGVLEKRENYEKDKLVLQENYHGGKKHGAYQAWYSNGYPKVSGMYVADAKHGKWLYYNPVGKLIREEEYMNGEQINRKSY